MRRRRLIGQAFEAGGGGGRLGDVGGASRAGGPGCHRRQHSGVREGRVGAAAQRVARNAAASTRLTPHLPPFAAAHRPVRRRVPAVQAGLRAETRLLAGLEERGGGGGGVPGAANALPSTQLEEAEEGGDRKEEQLKGAASCFQDR